MVRVHVRGGVAAAPALPTTLKLDNETIDFTEVSVTSNAPEGDSGSGNIWYKVIMPRADKRAAVRALFVSHSLTVSRMMQVAFGDISLTKELPRARHAPLKPKQLEQLYALAQLSLPAVASQPTGSERKGRDEIEHSQVDEPRSYTAREARAATRAPRSTKPRLAANPVDLPKSRAPQQRAALRRGVGGGSNRPSRPGARAPKK
jgi:hypothetical protein